MADPTTPVPAQRGPDSHSSDYDAQSSYWRMVTDVLAGVEAMRALTPGGQLGGPPIQLQNVSQQNFAAGRGIEAQSPYLPRFPNEPYPEYDRRRKNAFLTNVYDDISGTLGSKPFSKTCELAEGAGEDLVKLSENVDGLGNNLHVFAGIVFKDSMDRGITWILCDHTRVPPGATLADERAIGSRPYWVHVRPEQLVAVYSAFVGGREVIFHARIEESVVDLDGYEEKKRRRVRVFDRAPILREVGETGGEAPGEIVDFSPAIWQLLEEQETQRGDKTETEWVVVDSGDVSIEVIPLVPVILGKRDGVSWRVTPPLRGLLYMQIKLFQMESNLDAIKEMTAFPMLAGEGVDLSRTTVGADGVATTTQVKVPVGPRAVLATPPVGERSHGQWHFIEPSGTSLNFLQSDIDKYKTEMRELGMQPLATANLTVVTTSNISVKVHSVSQAWSLALKDALEQAWRVTVRWLGQTEGPTVNVHVPPVVRIGVETDKDWLLSAEAAGVVSPRTVREEAKRLGVLSDEFDEKEEEQRLAEHQQGQILQPEKRIDPVTGAPIVVTPRPGKLNPPPTPPVSRAQRAVVD